MTAVSQMIVRAVAAASSLALLGCGGGSEANGERSVSAFCEPGYGGLRPIISPVTPMLDAVLVNDPEGSRARVADIAEEVSEIAEVAPEDIADDVAEMADFWTGLRDDLEGVETPAEFDALAEETQGKLDPLVLSDGPSGEAFKYYNANCEVDGEVSPSG